MLFCASCAVKNCGRPIGAEGDYPGGCPSLDPALSEALEKYRDPEERLMARQSAVTSPDHGESRLPKTIRFAKLCGFQKLGLAFCITLKDEAAQVDRILRQEGFQVSSIICKVGHVSRQEVLGVGGSCNAMCNPIAQAELLNREKTQLNIVLGLCVGHDSLFIRHSEAPVTVLAAKDHVYDNAPLEYLKHLQN